MLALFQPANADDEFNLRILELDTPLENTTTLKNYIGNNSLLAGSYPVTIITDERFNISLTECSADTRVDFRFTSSGSTGVTNGHTLNIADSAQVASGIGIPILDKNNTLLTFDQDYTATTSTGDKEAVDIPLKARYIKTGDVRPGKVDAVAIFDVFYR